MAAALMSPAEQSAAADTVDSEAVLPRYEPAGTAYEAVDEATAPTATSDFATADDDCGVNGSLAVVYSERDSPALEMLGGLELPSPLLSIALPEAVPTAVLADVPAIHTLDCADAEAGSALLGSAALLTHQHTNSDAYMDNIAEETVARMQQLLLATVEQSSRQSGPLLLALPVHEVDAPSTEPPVQSAVQEVSQAGADTSPSVVDATESADNISDSAEGFERKLNPLYRRRQ